MKKIIIIFLTSIALSYTLRAQCDIRMYDIYTPNCSPVVTFLMCESSDQTRDYYDKEYKRLYPNATQIETYNNYSSTRKFNCHGHAWLRVEQGIDRWIGTGWVNDIVDPENIYMSDRSYKQVVNPTYPGKISWGSGDHSAVTTSTSGVLISKWNEYPLMQHAIGYSPYGTSNLKYYEKFPTFIDGSSQVCNTSSYSLVNPSSCSSTIYWTVSNTSLFSLSSSSGKSITVTKLGTTSGNATLKAYTGSAGGTGSTEIASIAITACAAIEINGPSQVGSGGNYSYLLPNISGATYSWDDGQHITVSSGRNSTAATYSVPNNVSGHDYVGCMVTINGAGSYFYKMIQIQ